MKRSPVVPELTFESDEAEQLVDCVVNRSLIPKILNIHVGKRPPGDYLAELHAINPRLEECLSTHLLPPELLTDPAWNTSFRYFLKDRADAIFDLIEDYTVDASDDVIANFGVSSVGDGKKKSRRRVRLTELLDSGKVVVGDTVYVQKNPSLHAKIIDGEMVEYQMKKLGINAWGQAMTGWPSINIYQSVRLVRTGKPLGDLRDN